MTKLSIYATSLIFLLLGIFLTLVLLKPSAPFPKTITSQTNYDLYYPGKNNDFQIDKSSVAYDQKAGVLTYSAYTASKDAKLIIAQQATPETFGESPQVYPALLSKMRAYKELDISKGKVSLTRPEELKGASAAVLNPKGTLMFARPSKDLSDDEWRTFFNNLEVIK